MVGLLNKHCYATFGVRITTTNCVCHFRPFSRDFVPTEKLINIGTVAELHCIHTCMSCVHATWWFTCEEPHNLHKFVHTPFMSSLSWCFGWTQSRNCPDNWQLFCPLPMVIFSIHWRDGPTIIN